MAWLTRDRRLKMPAADIAKSVFQVWVEQAAEADDPKRYNLPEGVGPQYDAKARLYREATVLMLLLSEAQSEKTYEEVLKSYEGLIFPSTPSAEGTTKLQALKHAMERISELVDPARERKELSWSMAWFAGIGHEETNPATLVLFAHHWIQYYIAVARSLGDLRPS